jgi:hypothetical protein
MGTGPTPDLPAVHLTTQSCPSSEGAAGVAIANLNGDGRPDVVISNSQDSTLTVYLNQGTPDCPASASFTTGRSPSALAVGDLNGDGAADVVVATGGDNTVSAHLGKGDGTLLPAVPYQLLTAISLALGDIDGKNGLDVVALSSADNAAHALFNRGDGTLSLDPAPYSAGRLLFALALAPLQSSSLDLILASAGDNSIGILGDGASRWSTQQWVRPADLLTPVSVITADLNADGRPDLVVPSHNDDRVIVLINQGSYQFVEQSIAVGHHPVAVAVADLTQDGRPDVVAVNSGEDTVQAIVNLDGNSFATSPLLKFPTNAQPVGVAVADLNGDGAADLVVIHRSAGILRLLGTR